MRIQLIAKVAHDILTNNIVQIRLSYANDAGYDRRNNHQTNKEKQQVRPFWCDGIIENVFNQQWIDQS